jgi:hypothetical protein
MGRFKELTRIERAIEHRNLAELQWALGYCQMRLKLAKMKHHEKSWRRIEKIVLDALESIQNSQ